MMTSVFGYLHSVSIFVAYRFVCWVSFVCWSRSFSLFPILSSAYGSDLYAVVSHTFLYGTMLIVALFWLLVISGLCSPNIAKKSCPKMIGVLNSGAFDTRNS